MNKNKTKNTISSYDKNASCFENKFLNFEPYKRKIILFHEKYLKNKETILDLGCGPGNNSKILFDLNPDYKITGIDLSEKMIELAKINAPKCTFFNDDIRDTKIKNKYDAILASFCIVHLSLEETEQFISKTNELLNSSGALYVSFMEGEKDGFEKTSFSDDEIYFYYHSKKQIVNLLNKNNLKILELIEDSYKEDDESKTNEIFIIAQKQ